MEKKEFDIIVIGAGVAGGVFAASQPKNLQILVIERDLTEPDRIVGELMQPGGIEALSSMNLPHLLENIDAQFIDGYKLINKDQNFTIAYENIKANLKGVGLRNGKFLTNIRKELTSQSNITLIEGNVTGLIEKDNQITGVEFINTNDQKETCKSKLVVISDGPMSLLREKVSKNNKSITSYFMGLVLKDLNLTHPAYGHMIVSGDAPILVYPIYSNAYRILIDYPGSKPPKITGKALEQIKENIAATLPKEMVQSFINAIDSEQLQVMPNHTMKAQALDKKGVVLLGDSLNMRHPTTGGGMTATFFDIINLNKELHKADLHNEEQLKSAVDNYYKNRGKDVETINILANALYEVFRKDDMKDACLEYLQQGGEQANGPLSILSGMNRDKKFLLTHFFKVAMQHPIHFITKPVKQIRLYKNATGIIRPILKNESIPEKI